MTASHALSQLSYGPEKIVRSKEQFKVVNLQDGSMKSQIRELILISAQISILQRDKPLKRFTEIFPAYITGLKPR